MTIILLSESYTNTSQIIEEYSTKISELCHQILNESVYKDVKSMSRMELSFVVKVSGEWLYAQLSFELREYESMTIDNVEILSDMLDDYYGHDNLESLLKEYGDEVRDFKSLTDDEVKELIETW